MDKGVVASVRKSETAKYDTSPALQRTWRAIFDMVRRNKATLHDCDQAQSGSSSNKSSSMWLGHMQAEHPHRKEDLPISLGCLDVCERSLFPTKASLQERAADASRFEIDGSTLCARQGLCQKPFGCAAEVHNSCRAGLSAKGLLGRFGALLKPWNKWIRSLPKDLAMSGDVVCLLQCGTKPGVYMWALMADAVFSPLAQVWALCAPAGATLEDDGFFRGAMPTPPYDIELQSRPSRMAQQGHPNRTGLWFVTSDELLAALVGEDPAEWSVCTVTYTLGEEGPSLLLMKITDHSDSVPLRASTRARSTTEDLFLGWLRLADATDARSAKRARANPRPLGSTPGSGSSPPVALADAMESSEDFGWEEHDEANEYSDENDALLVDNDPQLLEDMLNDIIEHTEGAEMESIDAAALGAEEPPDSTEGQEPQGPADIQEQGETPPPDEIDRQSVINVVDAVSASGIDAPAGSPSPSPPNVGQPLAPVAADHGFPECGFKVSDLGYVTCNWPGHQNDRYIGLVGWKRDRKSMFANCHLHSVCSISVGVMRRPVSEEYLARWLCLGQPPHEGATVAEKKAMGVEHRKLWVRPS